MQLLIQIIVGFFAALLVKYVVNLLGVPAPLDWVIALAVFLSIAFADRWR